MEHTEQAATSIVSSIEQAASEALRTAQISISAWLHTASNTLAAFLTFNGLAPLLDELHIQDGRAARVALAVALLLLALGLVHLLLQLLRLLCCSRKKTRPRASYARMIDDDNGTSGTSCSEACSEGSCTVRARLSLKFCWVSLPIPYISCACTPPEANELRGGAADSAAQATRAGGYGGGVWQSGAAYGLGNHPAEPQVTELVGLKARPPRGAASSERPRSRCVSVARAARVRRCARRACASLRAARVRRCAPRVCVSSSRAERCSASRLLRAQVRGPWSGPMRV